MMDEMKLKSGIYFNSSSLEVTGFASDGGGIDLDGTIKKFLRGNMGNNRQIQLPMLMKILLHM